MRIRRYRGKHLKQRRRGRIPAAAGTATVVWLAGGSAHAGTHVVRAGETLSAIAARYRTTVAALVKANDLSDADFIVAGQHLRVRTPAVRHRVAAGDTLSGIAARFGTTAARLARANDLSDPDYIVPGQSIRVPGALPSRRPQPRPRPRRPRRRSPSPPSRNPSNASRRRTGSGPRSSRRSR